MPEDGEYIRAEVLKTETFSTFKEMYNVISWNDMGAKGTSVDEMVENTYEIYMLEQEKQYGTVAITIKLIH